MFFGRGFSCLAYGKVNIGNHVSFGAETIISTGNHIYDDKFHRAGKSYACNVEIKDGCWFGVRTTVVARKDICINSGVVAAAGSVIIGDITNDVLVAGVPAVEKKKLFME